MKAAPIPDGVTLSASTGYPKFGDEIHLTGTVSTQRPNEAVTVWAQPYGQASYAQVGTVTTTTGGVWDFLVKPEILTNYQARFRTASSPVSMVQVQPKITFLVSHGVFTTHVYGNKSFGDHWVYVQQKSSLGQWVSLKKVLLNEDSSASFKMALKVKVPHPLRIFMTVNQAGAGYLASNSGTQVVVRRCSLRRPGLLERRGPAERSDYAPLRPSRRKGGAVSTLVFKFEEIPPRAQAEPATSSTASRARRSRRTTSSTRATSTSGTRSSASSPTVDSSAANQVYSDVRALKVDLSFAIGGIKNHEIYFEHLGGDGGDPTGAIGDLIKRDFGSADGWRADLKATGMAGRGWAWTAYDWDEGRLFNYIGDAQNTFPIWNATPLVALDVYEHAYFLDYQTDRGFLHRRVLPEPRLGR